MTYKLKQWDDTKYTYHEKLLDIQIEQGDEHLVHDGEARKAPVTAQFKSWDRRSMCNGAEMLMKCLLRSKQKGKHVDLVAATCSRQSA